MQQVIESLLQRSDAQQSNARQAYAQRVVDGDEVVRSDARRLSSQPSTFLSTQKMPLLHEFPASHACSLGSANWKVLLPLDSSNSVDWTPSPTLTHANLSLVSVNSDWSTDTIDTMPAPLKLVHDCGSEPALHLSLRTEADSLIVNGFDVGTFLSRRSPSTALIGTAFVLQSWAYPDMCVHPYDSSSLANGMGVHWWGSCPLWGNYATAKHLKALDAGDGKFVLQNGQNTNLCLYPAEATIVNNLKLQYGNDCPLDLPRIQWRALDVQGGNAFVLQNVQDPAFCVHAENGFPGEDNDLILWDDCNLVEARMWFRALSVASW